MIELFRNEYTGPQDCQVTAMRAFKKTGKPERVVIVFPVSEIGGSADADTKIGRLGMAGTGVSGYACLVGCLLDAPGAGCGWKRSRMKADMFAVDCLRPNRPGSAAAGRLRPEPSLTDTLVLLTQTFSN
jgi:hypothetical protein